jgi:hypothetical protein
MLVNASDLVSAGVSPVDVASVEREAVVVVVEQPTHPNIAKHATAA